MKVVVKVDGENRKWNYTKKVKKWIELRVDDDLN